MTTFETNATLVWRKDLTEELSIIRVLPDNGGLSSFVPGQYAELSIIETAPPDVPADKALKKLVRKAYSIASATDDPNGYEFYVALVPQGDLTPRLWQLNKNDRLWCNPKIKGKFTLDAVAPEKDLVLISTGTGIAPYISMLRSYGNNPPWRRFILIHGTRLSTDLGYREELEAAAKNPNIFYIPTVTREPEDSPWTGLRGRVQSIFKNGVYESIVGTAFSPEDCQIMLCGNPQMIVDMQSMLEERGFQLHKKRNPGQIHIERYW